MARKRTYQDLFSGRGRRSFATPLFLLTVVAIIVAYILIFSPLFWVKNVVVDGAKNVSPDSVRDAALQASESQWGPIISRSMVLTNADAVASRIKSKLHDLAKVEVTKGWPSTLRVSVTERQSTLLWKSKDNYYLVDQQGIAYAPGNPSDQLVLVEDTTGVPVEVGKQVVGSQFVKALLEIQQDMQAAGLPVKSFRIPETTFEIQAVEPQGWYALFDTTRPIATQVQALQLALKTQKPSQYADLRVPGRVYVK